MELENIIKEFLQVEMRYWIPDSDLEGKVIYSNFIKNCISGVDNRFLESIKKEADSRIGPDSIKISQTLLILWRDFYGEPIHLNEKIYPNARREFNQMLSPEFFLLCMEYVQNQKTEQISSILNSSSPSVKENPGGCLTVLPLLFFMVIFYLLF